MKKLTILSTALALALIVSPQVSLATEDGGQANLQETGRENREKLFKKLMPGARNASSTEERMAEKETRLADREEKRVERQEKLSDLRKEKIGQFGERMMKKLEAAFVRIEKLADRLTNRLAIIKERGGDISKPESLLAEAKTLIENGRESLTKAKEEITKLLDSDADRLAIFQSTRAIVRDAVQNVKLARAKVVEAITATKGASGSNDDGNNATTTATTTNQ